VHREVCVRRRQGVDSVGHASNEIESRHRVGLDETITAMAQTVKDMKIKYKETSEAGLAQSVVLC
jgi:L-serine dehydratase